MRTPGDQAWTQLGITHFFTVVVIKKLCIHSRIVIIASDSIYFGVSIVRLHCKIELIPLCQNRIILLWLKLPAHHVISIWIKISCIFFWPLHEFICWSWESICNWSVWNDGNKDWREYLFALYSSIVMQPSSAENTFCSPFVTAANFRLNTC